MASQNVAIGPSNTRREERRVLSKTRGEVSLLTQEFTLDGKIEISRVIEKAMVLGAYSDKDVTRFDKECYVLNEFTRNGLSKTYRQGIVSNVLEDRVEERSGQQVRFIRLDYIPGFNSSVIHAKLNERAKMLENHMAEHSCVVDYNNQLFNERAFRELVNNGRLMRTPNGIELQRCVKLLHRHSPYIDDKQRELDFEKIFDIVYKFHNQATRILSPDKCASLSYTPENYVEDFVNALDAISDFRKHQGKSSLRKRSIDNLRKIYEKEILPILLKVDGCMVHGDFTPVNVLIDISQEDPQKKYTLIDMGHVHQGNPLLDVANFTRYANLFCGMHANQVNNLWNSALEKYNVDNPMIRHITQVFRDIQVVGILSSRFLQKDIYTDLEMSAFEYRRNKYSKVLKRDLEYLSDSGVSGLKYFKKGINNIL